MKYVPATALQAADLDATINQRRYLAQREQDRERWREWRRNHPTSLFARVDQLLDDAGNGRPFNLEQIARDACEIAAIDYDRTSAACNGDPTTTIESALASKGWRVDGVQLVQREPLAPQSAEATDPDPMPPFDPEGTWSYEEKNLWKRERLRRESERLEHELEQVDADDFIEERNLAATERSLSALAEHHELGPTPNPSYLIKSNPNLEDSDHAESE